MPWWQQWPPPSYSHGREPGYCGQQMRPWGLHCRPFGRLDLLAVAPPARLHSIPAAARARACPGFRRRLSTVAAA